MTFEDIIITPVEDNYNFNTIIDCYFKKVDVSYSLLSDEEKQARISTSNIIKFNFENRPSYISFAVSKYKGLLYVNTDETVMSAILSKYWLIDENQNITMGVCTDWQFDLFIRDFDIRIRRVQERVIIENSDFGDERKPDIDLESMKSYHKKLVELRADFKTLRIKEPNVIQTNLDIDLLTVEIETLEKQIKTYSPMYQDNRENFKKYIKELDSFEFEKVNYDRSNDDVYDNNTFKKIDLFRLPKYNQFEVKYEQFIDSLVKNAYQEICFWDTESKKNVLKHLREKKLDFKKYWDFQKEYENLIKEESDDFDYPRFILRFFGLFGIYTQNEGFVTDGRFYGNYGYITTDAMYDLYDALMLKEATLIWLIQKIENNLGISLNDLENHHLDTKNQIFTKQIEFDNSNLHEIIKEGLVDTFLKHEERLKADGYITESNSWIDGRGRSMSRYDLARFILLLDDKFFFIKKKKRKLSYYKKFFENRYQCDLKEQFNKEKRDKARSIEIAKTTFPFVQNLQK